MKLTRIIAPPPPPPELALKLTEKEARTLLVFLERVTRARDGEDMFAFAVDYLRTATDAGVK